MKRWIIILILGISMVACGKKAEEAKTELTPEQEIQAVDSATMETKARLDSLGKSVDDLQNEVDSLLNENK
jgi:peptidoglycan hydrolase CwlO-like protein